MAKFNGRDIMLIGCLLGGGTSSSDIQMYATKVESGGDECPDTLQPDDVYFTIPAATVEGQREPQVGDYLIYDCLVANASGYNQILCEITRLDERGEPYRHGVYMRAICFMPVASGSEGGAAPAWLQEPTDDNTHLWFTKRANKMGTCLITVKDGETYDFTVKDVNGNIVSQKQYIPTSGTWENYSYSDDADFKASEGIFELIISSSSSYIMGGNTSYGIVGSSTDVKKNLLSYFSSSLESHFGFTPLASSTSIKKVVCKQPVFYKNSFTSVGACPVEITMRQTSVPTMQSEPSVSSNAYGLRIYVPEALYDEWIVATNWASIANYIYADTAENRAKWGD